MTSNFKVLDECNKLNNKEEVVGYINKIENDISQKQFNKVFSYAGSALKLILSRHQDEDITLDELIKDYTDMNIVPSKVIDSFYNIKRMSDEALNYSNIKDVSYKEPIDIVSAINCLKNIFTIIKYFRILENDINKKIKYNFKSNIYLKDLKINTEIPSLTKEDMGTPNNIIRAEIKTLYKLIFAKYSFLIPTYQRDYTWEKENVEVFLQDLLDRSIDREDHYIGSLAISINYDKKVIRLIDGQQRITTSLLLIKALINRYKKLSDLKMPKELKEISNKIGSKYCSKTEFGGIDSISRSVSFILSTNDSLEELIKAKNWTKSKAWINFQIITKFIDNLTVDDLKKVYTAFSFKFLITEIKFSNNLKNEINVFESLNSKGMELSQWDLIKNYIYKKVDFELLIKNEDRIGSMITSLFIQKVNSEFHFSPRKSKKQYKKMLEYKELSNFFEHYSRIAYKLKNGKILTDKGKIHKVFATTWPSENKQLSSMHEIRESLIPISRQLTIYCEIKAKLYRDPNSCLFPLKLALENTAVKDAHLPLMIHIIDRNSEWSNNDLIKVNNINSIKKVFNAIENYLTRLLVVSNKGQSLSSLFDNLITEDVDNVYNDFIKKIKMPGTQTTLPPFEDFYQELKKKNDWQKEYALAVLRTLEFNETNGGLDSNRYEIMLNPSLEHIMPRKAKVNSIWRTQHKEMNDAEFKFRFEEHLNLLGNYLILTSSINNKIKNSDFEKKKISYEEDKKSRLLTGNVKGELMNLLGKNSFRFEDIKVRTKQLAALIAPLYKFDFEKK